jgi:hypothetical protein
MAASCAQTHMGNSGSGRGAVADWKGRGGKAVVDARSGGAEQIFRVSERWAPNGSRNFVTEPAEFATGSVL